MPDDQKTKEVDLLFDECRRGAESRITELPKLGSGIAISYQLYWREVRVAYILQQHGAALLLATAFLEFALRSVLNVSPRQSLEKLISKASVDGLVDAKDATKLNLIRTFVRNRYAHGNFEEIAGNAPVKITTVQIKKGKATIINETDTTVAQDPFIQAIQKSKNDALIARTTLTHLRRIVTVILQRHAGTSENLHA